jgi:hypothetical protein
MCHSGACAEDASGKDESYDNYDGQGDYRFVAVAPNSDLSKCQLLKGQSVYSVTSDPGDSLFATGDKLSVFLKTARFAYIPDPTFLWFGEAGKGQVAIIANVNQSFDQMASVNGKPVGRVVYYASDLHQKQRINQSFFPVYGPVDYKDGALYLDMTVLELDHDEGDKLIPALLKTVASLGASELAATSPLVQGMLNAIGADVLSGAKSGDDIMAKYSLGVLQTHPKSGRVAVPVLKEGDLIIVRKSKRDEPIKWDELCYRHSIGKLELTSGKDDAALALGYVVFSIVKGVQGEDQGQYLRQVGDLLEEVRKGGDAGFISNVKASLAKIESEALESKYYVDAKNDINRLGDASTQYREVPATRLAAVVQLSLLRATDMAKFDSLKENPACSGQRDYFDRVVNTAQLENLVGMIKGLKLRQAVGDDQLATKALLEGADCATLSNKRSALIQQLAAPLDATK